MRDFIQRKVVCELFVSSIAGLQLPIAINCYNSAQLDACRFISGANQYVSDMDLETAYGFSNVMGWEQGTVIQNTCAES